MTAVVTSGQANNIRNGVGSTATDIVGRLPAGAIFRITGHPQCDADGLRWYPVEYGQIAGWTRRGSRRRLLDRAGLGAGHRLTCA